MDARHRVRQSVPPVWPLVMPDWMPDWVLDIRDELSKEFGLRYEMIVRWVENWTVNDKIFWASVATLIVVGGIVILNMTRGSRMGALRKITTVFALCFLVAYGFGISTGISAGGMSYLFGR